jgi:hypothetical protein
MTEMWKEPKPPAIYWAEAFNKFGNDDGADEFALDHTEWVAKSIEQVCFRCEIAESYYNPIIRSIINLDGEEVIPATAKVGYDDPLTYLPSYLVEHLRSSFSCEKRRTFHEPGDSNVKAA